MERKEIIRLLEKNNIPFSKKSNTKVLLNKLEKNITFKGIKAFELQDDGKLRTGGIGGSLVTLFEEGKTYEISDKEPIKLCQHGFHFYRTRDACFGSKLFFEKTVFHEIIAYGNVIKDIEKCVAKKIKIGKRIKIKIDKNHNSGDLNSGRLNSGNYNSGNYNSGCYNSGCYNSGDHNSGNRNSEDYNSGHSNSGNYNSGDYNSGYSNSGNYNSGNCNSGYYNSGDYNSGKHNSGHYNSGNYNSGDYNSGHRNFGNYNSGNCNSGNCNSGNCNSGNGYKTKFCTETKYFLFDIQVSEETYNNIRTNMYWFNLKDKTYKEAWEACPGENLNQFKNYPEFQTKNAKLKFKEITGLNL